MGYKSWKEYFGSFPFKTRAVFVVMVVYLALFTLISYLSRNQEFFFYAVVMFCFFLFIMSYYHRLRLTIPILVGIALHWLLHFLGGAVRIGDARLYDTWLLPHLFRYDNLVHAFGVFVLTFVAYNLLRPHFKLSTKAALLHFSVLLILVVLGLGALSEIGELVAVLYFDAAATVGGYFNNAFDLVFNLLGATLACIIINVYERRELSAATPPSPSPTTRSIPRRRSARSAKHS